MIELVKNISSNQQQWRNDPRINAWTRQNGIISYEDMEKWRKKIEEDPTIEMFGVATDRDEDYPFLIVGTCGLTSISLIHGTAEFSLLIDPEKQGQGYGKAALKALLDYGFKHLRLNCIWGETFEGNPALEMFKKLGMSIEGKCRQRYFKNGNFVDTTVVSILRSEWEKQTL